MKIFFCENESLGWGHARSNASVIIAARHQYPQATFLLHATRNHYARMKDTVEERHLPALDGVVFHEMKVTSGSIESFAIIGTILGVLQRYLQTFMRLWTASVLCRRGRCDVAVFLSGPGYHIRIVKWLGSLRIQRVPVVIVVHNWDSNEQSWIRQTVYPQSWAASRTRSRVPCRYVMQHGGMREFLEQKHDVSLGAEYVELWRAIVFGDHSSARDFDRERIDIDFLSPSHKGVDDFCAYVGVCRDKLAEHNPDHNVSFGVIGGYNAERRDRVIAMLKDVSVERYPDDFLTEEEYGEQILRATYVVHLFDPNLFRCRFSSAIQDAIAWRIPAIFLKNNYTAHLFRDLGEPGWQVDSIEEAADVTVELSKSFNANLYRQQVARVDKLRQAYSVENVAIQFGKIVSELIE